jgi:hypothetical protein
MRRLTVIAGFSLLIPGLAAAQSWGGGGGSAPDMPSSLLAPAQTPGIANTKVGATPGVYNQAGEASGTADTSRYDVPAGPAPVPASVPDAIDAPHDPSALADPPARH